MVIPDRNTLSPAVAFSPHRIRSIGQPTGNFRWSEQSDDHLFKSFGSEIWKPERYDNDRENLAQIWYELLVVRFECVDVALYDAYSRWYRRRDEVLEKRPNDLNPDVWTLMLGQDGQNRYKEGTLKWMG